METLIKNERGREALFFTEIQPTQKEFDSIINAELWSDSPATIKKIYKTFYKIGLRSVKIDTIINNLEKEYHLLRKEIKSSNEYKEMTEPEKIDSLKRVMKEMYERFNYSIRLTGGILLEDIFTNKQIDLSPILEKYQLDILNLYVDHIDKIDKAIKAPGNNEFRTLFEKAHKLGLVKRGAEVDLEILSNAITIKEANLAFADVMEKKITRKSQIAEHILKYENSFELLSQHIAMNSIFQFKPLKLNGELIDLVNLKYNLKWVRSYIFMLQDIYREGDDYYDDYGKFNNEYYQTLGYDGIISEEDRQSEFIETFEYSIEDIEEVDERKKEIEPPVFTKQIKSIESENKIGVIKLFLGKLYSPQIDKFIRNLDEKHFEEISNLKFKTPLVTLILCFFFLDRFYLGAWKLGILKIITFGGLYLWYIADIFLFHSNTCKANKKILEKYIFDNDLTKQYFDIVASDLKLE